VTLADLTKQLQGTSLSGKLQLAMFYK